MNADSFSELLQNPARLHQVTYQELRSLVLEYPYCQNLRMLLALKSRFDGRKEEKRDMEMAAAYALDRSYWFKQVLENLAVEAEESFIIQEDYLELKDLSEVENALRAAADEEEGIAEQEAMEEVRSSDILSGEESAKDEEAESSDLRADGKVKANEEVDDLFALFEEVEEEVKDQEFQPAMPWGREADMPLLYRLQQDRRSGNEEQQRIWLNAVEGAIAAALALESLESKGEKNAASTIEKAAAPAENVLQPQPKSSFGSWLKQFNSPQPLGNWPQEENAKPQDSGRWDFQAQMSVTENQDLASETLANLLERQGKYQKAIEIYERLRLIMPKKNAFFAQKIKELKNKL